MEQRLRLVGLMVCIALVVAFVGCAGTPTKESTGEYIDDTTITTSRDEKSPTRVGLFLPPVHWRRPRQAMRQPTSLASPPPPPGGFRGSFRCGP